MARFAKGETPKGAVPISSEEMAKEYQKRSVEARKANRTIREALLAELDKVDDASGLTRRQILIKKAMANHAKGKLSFKDLKDLADLLGESVQNLKVEGKGFQVVINTKEDAEAVNAIINREQ